MLQLTVIQVYKINDYFCGFVPTRDKIDQSLEVQIVGYSDIKSQGHPNLKWGIVSHGFPAGSNGKESACNAGDPGLTPGSGRSPEEGNVLAWRILWTEESGRLQYMGSQKSWTRLIA